MGYGIAGICLLKSTLNLRQEVQTLYRILDGCVCRQAFNGLDDLLLEGPIAAVSFPT